jgi:hypothetical protein
LWRGKRKYIGGLTHFVIFVTARYLWVVLPDGEAVAGFEEPLDLRSVTLDDLKARLSFLSNLFGLVARNLLRPGASQCTVAQHLGCSRGMSR